MQLLFNLNLCSKYYSIHIYFAAGLHSIVLYGTDAPSEETPSPEVATADLTLCIGLVVAFVIFLIVIGVIVKLLKKKSGPHPGYSLTPAGMNCDDGTDF